MDERRMAGIREPLLEFAAAGERALREHDDGRGYYGWRSSSFGYLLGRIKEEIVELEEAMEDNRWNADVVRGIMKEAVDVGVFCMMLWDKLRLDLEILQDEVTPVEKWEKESRFERAYGGNVRVFRRKFDDITVTLILAPGRYSEYGWEAERDGKRLWVACEEVIIPKGACSRCRENDREAGYDMYTHTTYNSDLSARMLVCDHCFADLEKEGMILDAHDFLRIEKWADRVAVDLTCCARPV